MSVDKLKALQEQKGRIIAEQRSVIDAAEKDGRPDFNAEERAQFDKHDAAIADIDRKIKFFQEEEADKRSLAQATEKVEAEKRNQATENANEDARTKAFETYMRYGFTELTTEQRSALGKMVATSDAINQRAQSTSGSAGGYTIPRAFSQEFDIALKAFGGMLQAGRTWTTGDGAPVDWPTVDDTANKGYILGENADATTGSSDFTFGQKTLGAYTYTSGVIKISNQLLQDSYFNLSSFIADGLATRLGRIQNDHLTTGDGSSKPYGIITDATAVTGAGATAITFDNLIDLVHSVDPLYRNAPGAGLMFNDSTLAAIRKLKDNYGQYIWTMGNVASGIPSKVLGYDYIINQSMASIATTAKTVAFGDFKRYVIRRVQDVLIRRLEERYAEFNQVGFVGFMRMDGKLLNTAAVKVIQHA